MYLNIFICTIYLHTKYIYSHEDNPMLPFPSSPQWLSGDVPAMDGQWRSSRIVSIGNSRVLNNY